MDVLFLGGDKRDRTAEEQLPSARWWIESQEVSGSCPFLSQKEKGHPIGCPLVEISGIEPLTS